MAHGNVGLEERRSMQEQGQAKDGRIARRLGNRARILDALFALIQAGTYHPTLKQIAAQAGVTPRTLLNHFPDGSSLLLAAAEHGRRLAEATLPALPTVSDPEQRVREFFRSAAAFYDGFAATRWSVATNPASLSVFEASGYKGVALGILGRRILELFSSFDVQLDPVMRRALSMITDPLTWRLLRVQQGLSRSDAVQAMSASVVALGFAAQRRGQGAARKRAAAKTKRVPRAGRAKKRGSNGVVSRVSTEVRASSRGSARAADRGRGTR
jgi:AcrR family transcriptional regulator